MATVTTKPEQADDERVAAVGGLSRVLTRPDTGAFIGAVAVFLLFSYYARGIDWAGDISNYAVWTDQAAQYGIVAVPVALLMIGGEFDLSAGVMVGSSGLLLAYLVTDGGMNVWPAMALVIAFGLAIGFLNGITVVKTKLPSFIVTLATFFVLQGVNAAGRCSSPVRRRSETSTSPGATTRRNGGWPRRSGARTTSRSRSCGGSG